MISGEFRLFERVLLVDTSSLFVKSSIALYFTICDICLLADVSFTNAASRQMRKLPASVQAQILAKIERFATTGTGNVKALQGREGFRLRAGDYRILLMMTEGEVAVYAVGHRREIYD